MSKPPRYVLDTEAFVLYLLAREGGAIQRMLREAEAGRQRVMMNVYNLAEVYVQLAQRLDGDQLDQVVRASQALPIHRVSVSDHLVFAAARLRAKYELNEATAIAMATALQEDAILVTGETSGRTPEGVSVYSLVRGRQPVTAREMLMSLA